jgi:hypothetical protein
MEDKTKMSVMLCALLILSGYSYIKHSECKAYEHALEQSDAGYAELLSKTINGKMLADYLDGDSVGTFKIKDKNIACALIVSPLPNRPVRSAAPRSRD